MRQESDNGSDTDAELKRFGRALQRQRQDAGLEQEEAARLVGISRVTLSRYENGKQRGPHDVIHRLQVAYAERSVPRGTSDTPISTERGAKERERELGRQLQLMALDFEREMLQSEVDDDFRRYAKARLRDPELLELYAGGHTEKAMSIDEQVDDYEDLIEELRGRLKRRLAMLKKRRVP
jgi:transcriptional regulator with XRE-family HTH domain